MKLFDYINAINSHKDVVNDSSDIESVMREYKPFLVNKSFSFHQDSILAANAMNIYSHLDKKLQYDFFINILRPRKRYSKWFKRESNDDLDTVAEYFGYNYVRAKEVLEVLTDEDIKKLKQKLEKGGKNDGVRHK